MKVYRVIIALAFAGVGSLSATEPIDDVYYWPEVQVANTKKAEKATTSTAATTAQPAAEKTVEKTTEAQSLEAVLESETAAKESAEPQKVEFVNIQDTVVTIRINR